MEKKVGHPVLALVLGILGIIAAMLLCLLLGIVGGAVAGVLGVAAMLIGIFGKKAGGKGLGGIIAGALAIFLAVSMTVSAVNVMKTWRSQAEESGEAPLVVKYLDKPEMGVLGILLNVPQDEATTQELIDQINKVK